MMITQQQGNFNENVLLLPQVHKFLKMELTGHLVMYNFRERERVQLGQEPLEEMAKLAAPVSQQRRTSPRLASPFSKLPPELLTIAFQFLPFPDLKNALLVCRLAYSITRVCTGGLAFEFVLSEGPGEMWASKLVSGLRSS